MFHFRNIPFLIQTYKKKSAFRLITLLNGAGDENRTHVVSLEG